MDHMKNFVDVWVTPSIQDYIMNTSVVQEKFRKTTEWFWNPDFWLPVNFTWEDIQPTEDLKYPDTNDILTYPFIVAMLLLLVKSTFFYPYICFPVARYFKLNCNRPRAPPRIKELEALYLKYGHHVPKILQQRVTEKLKWKNNSVERWFYQRHACTRHSLGEKFAETLYMAICHFIICLCGYAILYKKIWVKNIIHCWEGYPYHEIDNDIWYYYIFMLGFFWSLTFWQLFQPVRNDGLSMYIHHFFSITLLSFSWTLNFVRVGSLVLLVHQTVDWVLLAAKLSNYLKKENWTSFLFAITFIVWIITRLIIFPFWIIHSAIFVGPTYMFMPSAYLFYGLMIGLLCLNLMWMGMMIAVIVRKVRYGKIDDVRSSDEMSNAESEDESSVSAKDKDL